MHGRLLSTCLLLLAGATMPMVSQAATTDTSEPSKAQCNTAFVPASGDYDFREANLTEMEDKRIGEVHVTRLPIFNEENERENNWLFRWANRIHKLTTETNVRNQLLFTEGDTYDLRQIEESARLLRDLGHLYDANIKIVESCDEDVDLEIITRDVWSLTIDASFSRSGGENDHRFGIGESNLFGNGKKISIVNDKDDERESNAFSYQDNNLLGSRVRGVVRLEDSDDGDQYLVQVALPFYALDTRSAWGVSFNQHERVDSQYFRGKKVTEINHNIDDYAVYYGFSEGLVNNLTQRWFVGYRYSKDTFSPGPGLPAPATAPLNKELSYPFVQYQAIQDQYTTAFNLDQIHRTEDLHLGYSFFASVGYADTGLGSDFNRLIVRSSFEDTLIYNEKILLQHNARLQGIWNFETETSEDVILEYNIKYFRSQTPRRSFFAQLNLLWSDNLNSNQQIVLGGDTGVRGYDRRFQIGDRRAVLSLEERQYTDYHLLNLAYLGFAVFIDIGRAWNPDIPSGLTDKYLASAGVGIRLASSKADQGRIVHIDFAFPLTNRDEPEVDSSDVSVNIKTSL